MLEELKSILRNYAKKKATYDLQTEMESDERTEWHYFLKSECSGAFHDESNWENVEIFLSEKEPEPGEDYIPIPKGHKAEPKDLYSQLEGFSCSVTSWWKNSVADMHRSKDDPFYFNWWWYDITIKSIMELDVDDNDTPFRWITVMHNKGYM